ncbi:MAG TPA: ATP-binding protein [Rhizobacter sp.]|nr:ATP-binding protein [Rhizobacter sp.]
MAASERIAPASRWRSDLWLVAALTLACYFVASALELRETFARWLAPYERWQVDEIPFTLTVLACGLAWYALRRRREAQAELLLRERAEAQMRELLAHNRELARQLIALQENERLALARELHDELGQGCAAIRVATASIRTATTREGSLLAAERADSAAQRLYQLVRGMLRRLRPANLDELGLIAALQELCESWEERSGVPCIFHHEAQLPALGDAIDITLYRVTQEALTNVMRHAQAGSVRVVLGRGAQGELCLSIQDDGVGMAAGAATRGLGLLGAAERAAALGGELQVQASPGGGVCLRLSIPLPAVPSAVAPREKELA